MHSLNGQLCSIPSKNGFLYAYVKGQGKPLLLVHTVNAAASAAEVRPIFDLMSQHRTVYAIDLPGYGTSERSARLYTPRLMTDAILDLSTSYGQKTTQADSQINDNALTAAAQPSAGSHRAR